MLLIEISDAKCYRAAATNGSGNYRKHQNNLHAKAASIKNRRNHKCDLEGSWKSCKFLGRIYDSACMGLNQALNSCEVAEKTLNIETNDDQNTS